MFDKRLLAMVPEAKKYIAGNVALQWIALLANVVVMVCLGLFVQGAFGLGAEGQGVQVSALTLALVVAAAIIVRMAATVAAQRLSAEASICAKRVIRTALYDKLLRLGLDYLNHTSTAEATQVSVEGVEQLEVYFGAYMPQFFYAVLAPITLFACLAPLSLPAAVVLLVCVPLIPGSIMMFQKIAKRLMKNYWGSYTDLGGTFLENIQGLTTLKIYQADEARHAQMNGQAEGFRRATMSVLRMQLNSVTIMDVLAYGGAAIGIIIVMAQYLGGSISFAAAFAIVFLSADFFLPMRALGSLFHTAMNGMAAADRMFSLLAVPEPEGRSVSIDGRPATVSLQGVSYSYDGQRMVLNQVDFEAQPGQFVGIVGESGSGKSTLAGVINGRNAGFSGVALVGGEPLEQVDRATLARFVSTVSFNSRLFAGSLRDNLAMAMAAKGEPDADAVTEKRMWGALERAQIADFVRTQGGLDMPIAEDAANLSGGQRQRLVLARALLQDAPLYLFDEATSSIDPASEEAVMRVVAQLVKAGKTVIMVSHRLRNVQSADAIYAMEDGRVVQVGTHEQLMAQGGAYATMVEGQQRLERFAAAGGQQVFADELPEEPEVNPMQGQGAQAGMKRRSGLQVMGRMIGLVKPLAGYMVLAVLLGVAGFACAIAVTVIGATALTSWAGGSTTLPLVGASVVVAVVAVLRGPLHYGEQICNHYIAFRLLALVRDKVFAALRRLAPAKLEGKEKGNLISLVTADIELLEVFYAHTISPVIICVVMCVGLLAVMACQSPLLALVAVLAYAVIGVVVPLCASKASAGLGAASRGAVAGMNAFVLEGLRCLTEIIQFGQGATRRAQLVERMDAYAGVERRMKVRSAWSTAVTYGLVLAFDAAMAVLAAQLVAAGQVTAVQGCLCLALLMSGYGPVIAVANLGTTLQATLASGARVLDLLDETPQVNDVTDGVSIDGATQASISIQDVSFSYGAHEVLAHVSVNVAPGRVLRIAGKSGSGKSTLCKLLMRFWDVTEGRICVAGADLRQVNTASLRRNQAYMTQDTHLFAGTLRENLLLANPQATPAQLESACRKAALSGLLARLPQGLDTPVGELGDTLSGGERQRIGLARVFLHDAPIILLDEPTSNLDALSEAAVLDALNREKEGKTVILVSHRQSTASLADNTVTVESGRVS